MEKKDNLLILLGPTAIGKTDLSISLAKKLNGEIISCDSMQIYKYMDIGSAKVTEEEMDGVPHYLVDCIDPEEEFTVADFKREAKKHIRDINSRGKIPIVTGGTGLYINSLVYDLNFTQVAPNEEFRKELEDLARDKGNSVIYDKLRQIDPESIDKISEKDTKRIIRALEIYEMTGKTMSEQNENFRKENTDYNLSMIGLNMDRQKLYDRINLRVDLMLENGLLDEVKGLMEMGYTSDLVSMKGIGYKEVISYLNGEMEYDEFVSFLKQKTRNYAKRQLTWFRRDERIKWVNVDEYEERMDIVDDIINYFQNIFK